MESRIAKLICLKSQPVAVLHAEEAPAGAMQFKEGVWGCSVALLAAASKGKTVVFTDKTTVCLGAKTGLGFQDYPHGWIEYFLSTGGERIGREGEFYKKTPELARDFIEGIRRHDGKPFVVCKPLRDVADDEGPLAVIFLVNADQLSGLATLANYDQRTQDNVKLLFGAGCAQAVLYPVTEEQEGGRSCYIGLTDPSARKCVPQDMLSFGIPYSRFLEMEQEAEESFLTKATWQKIAARLEK